MRSSSRISRLCNQAALILLASALAQVAGAANRTAVRSGNWSDATLATTPWANANNSCVASPAANVVPVAGDTVFICNGVTVTLDVNSASGALTVNSGGILQGNNTGKILTVSGTITNTGPSGAINFSGATAATIALGANSTWAGTGAWNLNDINLANRALTPGATAPTTLNLAAATPIVRTTGTATTTTATTWNFNGSAAQTLPAAGVTYGNISVNNSAGVTLGVTLTSSNNLGNLTVGNVSTGLLTVPNAMSITLASGKNFQLLGSSTLDLQGTAGMVTVSGVGTKTFGTSSPCSTVSYSGTAQTVSNESYGHLTLGGSGAKTMPGTAMTVACNFTVQGTATATTAADLTVNGNATVGTGASFTVAGFNFTLAGTTSVTGTLQHSSSTGATKRHTGLVTINAGGTWNNSGNAAIDFRGGITHNGTAFTAGSGVQTFDTNAQAVGGSSALSIPSATVTSVTLTNNSTVGLTVGTALSGTGGLTQGASSLLTLSGTSGISTLTASVSPNTVTYNGASAQTVHTATYHDLTLSNAAGTSLGGATTVNGNLTISSGTLSDSGNQITGNASGTLGISSGAGLTLGSAGTGTAFPTNFIAGNIALNATSTVTYAAGVAQTVSAVPTYGNLAVSNTTAVVSSLGGSTTVAGTLTLGGNAGATLAVGANTLTLNGPAIAGTPTKLTTTSSSNLTFGGSSGGVSVPSSVTSLNNLTLGNAVTLNSAITLAGNVLISSGGSLDVVATANTLTIAGNFTNNNAAGSFNARSSTVTMNGSAAQTIGGTTITTFNNLTIANSNSGTTVAVNTNINVSGTLTVNTSAPLVPAAAVVINSGVAGTTTITGTGTAQVTRTAATTDYSSQYKFTTNTLTNLTAEYKGSGAQTVSAVTYGGLTINNSSGATLASGTTTVGGATLTLTLTSGTLSVAGNTLVLNGPTIAGTPTNLLTTSSSTLSFGGSSSGVNVPSNVTQLSGLTLSNSNGITLNSSPPINGTLTFTAGVITAGSNTVIIPLAGTVSRTSGHVNGNLQKNVGAGANVVRNFEVGDSSIYSPVQVTFANVTAAGNLIAKAVSGEHPDIANSTIDALKDVGRYWVVTNSGVGFNNYSASWTYVAGDVDVGADATLFGIGQADSCPSLLSCIWTYPTIVGTPSTTNAQASGMTGFSSFAVGRNVRSFLVEASAGGNVGTQVENNSFTIKITALDQSGNVAQNFSGTVNVVSSCTLSSGGGTTTNFISGVLNLLTVTNSSGGACTITATRSGGSETGTSNTYAVISRFNVVDTGANGASGKIFTKVAGQNFSLDVVALTGTGAIVTGFIGTVSVELVDNSGGGACTGLPNIATLPNQTFVALDNGRHAISPAMSVSNVYRNAVMRITSASPAVTSCSGDNFAIRPASFTISVTDFDWQTAGTTRVLNNSSTTGGNVHKAGQPFTITATASPNTVSLYNGNLTVKTLGCTSFAGCAAGTLAPGTWGTGVSRNTSTATYSEAGSFNLELQDLDFASVDATDGSDYIVSQAGGAIAVGRSVPDHFKFATTPLPSTPQLQTFGSSCSTRSFTYIGQSFWYVTLPSAQLQAVAADGSTVTTNYRGSLFKLSTLVGNGITETFSVAVDSTGIGSAQLTELSGVDSG